MVKETEICKICDGRPATTKHHVIPKSFTEGKKVKICTKCHFKINDYFSNYELYQLAKKDIYPTTKEFKDILEKRIEEIEGLIK